MYVNDQHVAQAGLPLDTANKVLVMLHGRGDSATAFIQLANQLQLLDFAIVALQAKQNTWYPYSFLEPLNYNEPQLSNSMFSVNTLLSTLKSQGYTLQDIYMLGFSQGACLLLEYSARNATRYGGIIAFTGGLLGNEVDQSLYHGNFEGTPIFIGASDLDPHVPESRIDVSETILSNMGAAVTKKIYPGMGHTINTDEINIANAILNNSPPFKHYNN